MIGAAVFCPHPPLLVPEVAAGTAGQLDDLRAQCRAALRRGATGDNLVLIGAGERSCRYGPGATGSLAGYGVPVEVSLGAGRGVAGTRAAAPQVLPLALTIGAVLARDAFGPGAARAGFAVGRDFAGSAAAAELAELAAEDEHATLVVMADGSARRCTTAPGYLDERAAGFDARVADALRGGDAAALAALDPVLGEQLLAAGARVWPVAGALLVGHRYDARLHYDAAPYGVGYFVASWTRRG